MANETTDSSSSVDNSSVNPLAGIFGNSSPSAQAAAQTPSIAPGENPLTGVFGANRPPVVVPAPLGPNPSATVAEPAPTVNPLAGIFGNRLVAALPTQPARTTAEPE